MEPTEYLLMDAAEGAMWWYRALHRRLLDALGGDPGAVLDAGCGTGGLLARMQGAATGLEFDPVAAALARGKSGAAIVCGSVNAMPFADGRFDVVVSADVLCHAGVRPEAALGEFRRVLRPGGRLVLNMPAFAWMLSAHDRRVHNARRVTAGELRGWLTQAGFRVRRVRYWNSLLFPLMLVQRLIAARGDAASDVAAFPPWQDALFFAVTSLERRMGLPLPFGGSVMAIAERPA